MSELEVVANKTRRVRCLAGFETDPKSKSERLLFVDARKVEAARLGSGWLDGVAGCSFADDVTCD